MRTMISITLAALGLAASLAPANAALRAPSMAPPEAVNIVQVSAGCGYGFHPNHHGYCVRNHHYAPYAYRYPRPYPYRYYGGWSGPSPSDYVANQLNRQELGRIYYGY